MFTLTLRRILLRRRHIDEKTGNTGFTRVQACKYEIAVSSSCSISKCWMRSIMRQRLNDRDISVKNSKYLTATITKMVNASFTQVVIRFTAACNCNSDATA